MKWGLLGLGLGCITAVVGYFSEKDKEKERERKMNEAIDQRFREREVLMITDNNEE